MLTVLQIQNDQCQEMDQSSDKKWLKLTNHGEWATHTVRFPVPWDELQLILQMHASKSVEEQDMGSHKQEACLCTVWLAAFIAVSSVFPVTVQSGKEFLR